MMKSYAGRCTHEENQLLRSTHRGYESGDGYLPYGIGVPDHKRIISAPIRSLNLNRSIPEKHH
jgi:hypothetical protein